MFQLTTLLSDFTGNSIDDNDCCKSDDERLWSLSRTINEMLDCGCIGGDNDGPERSTNKDERRLLIISFNSLILFFNWVFSTTRASI